MMHVNLYATLRQIAGTKRIEIAASTALAVRTALEEVTTRYARLAPEVWKTPGELQDSVHVFLNGRETRWLPEGLDTLLQPGDTLDVFPPVGGGGAR